MVARRAWETYRKYRDWALSLPSNPLVLGLLPSGLDLTDPLRAAAATVLDLILVEQGCRLLFLEAIAKVRLWCLGLVR